MDDLWHDDLPALSQNGARGDGQAEAAREALRLDLEGTLGYRVFTSDGAVLGRLAWLRYGFANGQIEVLMVQPPGWRALFPSLEQSIPSGLVETVSHRLRRIVVSALYGEGRLL